MHGAALRFGIGSDICHVRRIDRLVQLYGDRFLNRAFHSGEIATFRERAVASAGMAPVQFLASRWAAKEALHKAIASSVETPTRLLFPELEVNRRAGAAPGFRFHGEAADWMERARFDVRLSLSHDGDYAMAVVMMVQQQQHC